MGRNDFSVVEYFSDRCGDRCGYCRCHNSYFSCGMWSHSISEREYQHLIDRGWRRSGKYTYKPRMNITCCPMYTIRCEVGNLKVSKSQKKVLKKFYNHLKFGDTQRDIRQTGLSAENSSLEDNISTDVISSHMEDATSKPAVIELDKIEMDTSPSDKGTNVSGTMEDDSKKGSLISMDIPGPSDEVKALQGADSGASGSQPLLRKAKLIRLENKFNKLIKRGMTEEEAKRLTYEKKKSNPEKKPFSFEDYFTRPEEMSHYAHKFRTELVPVSQLLHDEVMLQETHRLYAKYQEAVHNDSPDRCSVSQLQRFLIESPLYDSKSNQGPPSGFGSFHQQYWLDDRLIAVGVIDILPYCVSSVYFFYDPDLRSLSLGTFGSLHEMFYTRALNKVCASIKYYYLGYYIHSCPKMNYKGQFCPSYLLCPETITWHPIENCRPLLDKNKYSRLERDPSVANKLESKVNLSKVRILQNRRVMSYTRYKDLNPAAEDEREVIEYAKLVGEECYQSLLLFRN